MKKPKLTNEPDGPDSRLSLQKNKGKTCRVLMAFILMLGIIAGLNCQKRGGHFQKKADAPCGSIDSVKNALPGEISVYIFNKDKDANYFLVVNVGGSDKRYQVITNAASDWGFYSRFTEWHLL